MRAMPWGWAAWFFTSLAVMLGDKYKLVTPTQDTFLLIITQFTVLMGIDRFYLKQGVSRSDVVAFLLILVAIAVSFGQPVSRLMGWPLKKKSKDKKK